MRHAAKLSAWALFWCIIVWLTMPARADDLQELLSWAEQTRSLKLEEKARLESGETWVNGYAIFGQSEKEWLVSGDPEFDQMYFSRDRIIILDREIEALNRLVAVLEKELTRAQSTSFSSGGGRHSAGKDGCSGSFAEVVTDYRVGDPAPVHSVMKPAMALGQDDFNEAEDSGYVTLGCHGSLTLRFDHVVLIDGPGPDLQVFEIGEAVEPFSLEVSESGQNWLGVGRISGGTTRVDLADKVPAHGRYRFVRLTDLGHDCNGDWPGADVDAVAVLNCTTR